MWKEGFIPWKNTDTYFLNYVRNGVFFFISYHLNNFPIVYLYIVLGSC